MWINLKDVQHCLIKSEERQLNIIRGMEQVLENQNTNNKLKIEFPIRDQTLEIINNKCNERKFSQQFVSYNFNIRNSE